MSRRVAAWTILLSIAGLSSMVGSGSSSPGRIQAGSDGVIAVTVMDAGSGRPVPDARVIVMYFEDPPPNSFTNLTSDPQGLATASGMPLGTYTVRVESPGYSPLGGLGIPVTLDAEHRREDLRIDLTRGGTLSGRVLDVEGNPMESVEVAILRKSYGDGRPVLVRAEIRVAPLLTDEFGAYVFTGLEPGEYFLRANIPVPLEQRFSPGPWDAQLRRFYYPNVHDVDQAIPLRVEGPVYQGGLDLRTPDVPTYSISGTVVNPLPGVPIQEDGVEFRAVTSFFLVPRTSIATDRLSLARSLPQWAGLEPGSDETPFLLTGIPPGSYDLYPVFQLGGGDTPRASSEYLLAYREEVVTSRTEVNVIDRDIEDLRIVLQPNGAISGRVVITGDGGGIDPGLLSVRLDPGRLLPTHTSAFGVPDELKLLQPVDPDSGAFAFQGLPQGSYAAAVAGLPADAYVADMRLGALSIMQGGRFDVSTGLGLPLEIRIAPDGAVVEGTVLDRNREGVPRAGVVLVPDAPNRNNRTLYRRLTADMSGRFVLRGVAPGRYKAFSWPELPEGGAEEYPPFLAQFELQGQSLAVRAGETQTVSLQVIPARSD